MPISPAEVAPQLLTYEEYLAEGEVFRRYDIVDGVRIFMANPTRRHQRILLNVARALQDYEARTGRGQALVAPQDVLIRRAPLRTRQPDILYITQERLARNRPADDPAPLDPAPELVVELLSPNERSRSRADKLLDYSSVGVLECWVLDPAAETVEVLRLSPAGPAPVACCGREERARSALFPDLEVELAPLFRD